MIGILHINSLKSGIYTKEKSYKNRRISYSNCTEYKPEPECIRLFSESERLCCYRCYVRGIRYFGV